MGFGLHFDDAHHRGGVVTEILVNLAACAVITLALIIIYWFFLDVFKGIDMADKSAVQSLKDGTAIVVVNYIAKSGMRQGYTFHNVTPVALQEALTALDKPEFAPMQMQEPDNA